MLNRATALLNFADADAQFQRRYCSISPAEALNFNAVCIMNMPDDKVKALIVLAEYEFTSLSYKQKSGIRDKREAFARPEKINLNIPADFNADSELSRALGEKYGVDD